jgi:hypothetical protein
LAAKLTAISVVLFFLWMGITRLLPPPLLIHNKFLGYDLAWTLAAGALFLVGCGAVYLAILDQRYRCRVCLRRLRMPITIGSWGQMLMFGRPRIEYICPFGHGTLKVPELQISGLEPLDWLPHDEDIWKELCGVSGNGEDERARH